MGRLEVPRRKMRRPAPELRLKNTLVPGKSAELPFDEPQLFGRAKHALQVVHARVREQRFELVGVVPRDPIHHVAAVRRARGTHACFETVH
jgi:hypothetical protein